jgi:hypothetical protein
MIFSIDPSLRYAGKRSYAFGLPAKSTRISGIPERKIDVSMMKFLVIATPTPQGRFLAPFHVV